MRFVSIVTIAETDSNRLADTYYIFVRTRGQVLIYVKICKFVSTMYCKVFIFYLPLQRKSVITIWK